VGQSVAAFAADSTLAMNTDLAERFIAREEQRVKDWLGRRGEGPNVYQILARMADVMIDKVGIFRSGPELAEAVAQLDECLADCGRAALRSRVAGMNPELSDALRLEGMIRLAIVTARGALARTESRGAHFRSDFPLRDDERWLKRTLVRWPTEAAQPEFSYEPVGLLDLPPGHRGYGKAEWVEMTTAPDDYNRRVAELQTAEGRPETREAPGTRLRPGAWRKVTEAKT